MNAHSWDSGIKDYQREARTVGYEFSMFSYRDLYFFAATAASVFPNIVLAQGACGIDVQPFIDADTMKMVATREFTELCAIIIS